MSALESIEGICDVERFGADGDGDLLIEVPHGATRHRDFLAVRARLRSDLPDDLDAFFFVNTDVGAPECAREIAGQLASELRTVVLIGRVPRTFVDLNRLLEPNGDARPAGLTPPLPEYITAPEDIELLSSMHRRYHEVARRAYERICGRGGRALALHTYAPRSVRIDRVDGDIVRALRAAYEPEAYDRWEPRPDVDLITHDPRGRPLAPRAWVAAVQQAFAAIGIEAPENATYHLHPDTSAHTYAEAYPDRTLCLELNRALLAEPFTPFAEMHIGPDNVRRLSAPIAESIRITR
jgi:hypothetical protein